MTTILVIDDDPETTSMLETIIAGDTHSVQAVSTRQDGLRLLRERSFDVVITDITLQEFASFEAIWEINSMQPRPRVIAMADCTGSLNRKYLLNVAESLSVQCLLYKPFSIDELQESVFRDEG